MTSRATPPRGRRSHGLSGAPGKGPTSVTVSPLSPELQTQWTVVLESGVPDLPPGQQFLRHNVTIVVLSAEPVFDEAEGSKGKNNNKKRFVRPPSAQAAERKVGFEGRPDTFCVLNRNDVRL
ncbi:hypothetical protein EJB05_55463, partial [Eragrostis curvula]